MPVLTNSFKAEISALIANKDFAALKGRLAPWLPADVAPILSELPVVELAVLFRGCSKELAAAVFSYLDHGAKHKVLKMLTQAQTAALLNELPSDDRTAFLHVLPLDVAMQLICLLTPEERKITQDLLAYPEHSVGRMMTLDFVAVQADWTVRESLDYIRVHGFDRETLNMVYVTDAGGYLVDDIRVRRFLLAEPDTKVSALMDGNFATLAPTDDREKALQVFRKYDRVALPVTNPESKLIGIVTADDMLDVAEMRAMAEALFADRELSFTEKLHRFTDGMTRRFTSISPQLLRDLQRFAPRLYRHIEDLRHRNIPLIFGRLLQQGQAAGMVRAEIDPAFAIEFWRPAIQSLMHPDALQRLQLRPDQVFTQAITLFFGGLLTPAGRKAHEKYLAR